MDYQTICRVCTGTNSTMVSIFESYNFSAQNCEIFKVITDCASVQIQKFDGFPEQICCRCLHDLSQAYSFKKMCEHSDYKFRSDSIANRALQIKSEQCNDDVPIDSDIHQQGILAQEIEAASLFSGAFESMECEGPSAVEDAQCTENENSTTKRCATDEIDIKSEFSEDDAVISLVDDHNVVKENTSGKRKLRDSEVKEDSNYTTLMRISEVSQPLHQGNEQRMREKFVWTDGLTLLLLEEYIVRNNRFRNSKIRKKDLWQEIANVFASKNIGISMEGLDKKFRNLKATYMRIKENQDTKATGVYAIKWRFFKIMNDIFIGKSDITENIADCKNWLAPAVVIDPQPCSSQALNPFTRVLQLAGPVNTPENYNQEKDNQGKDREMGDVNLGKDNLGENNHGKDSLTEDNLVEDNLVEGYHRKDNLGEHYHGKDNLGEDNYGKVNLGQDNQEKDNLGEGYHRKDNFSEGNHGQVNLEEGNHRKDNLGEHNYGKNNLGQDNQEKDNLGEGYHKKDNLGGGNHGKDNLEEFHHGKDNLREGNHGRDNLGEENHGKDNLGEDYHEKDNLGEGYHGKDNLGEENHGKDNLGQDNHGKEYISNTNPWQMTPLTPMEVIGPQLQYFGSKVLIPSRKILKLASAPRPSTSGSVPVKQNRGKENDEPEMRRKIRSGDLYRKEKLKIARKHVKALYELKESLDRNNELLKEMVDVERERNVLLERYLQK